MSLGGVDKSSYHNCDNPILYINKITKFMNTA